MDFSETMELYKDAVYKAAFIYCKNRTDAEDVFQETFLAYFHKAPDFHDENHRKAWLLRVAMNKAKSLLRSPWVRRTTAMDDCLSQAAPASLPLTGFIMELPPKYRAVIHLYYYEGYSAREVGEILGITETAAQTRLQRAREKLKVLIREENSNGYEQV